MDHVSRARDKSAIAVVVLACLAACGEHDAEPLHPPPVDAGVPDGDAGGCAPGEAEVDGACVIAGIPAGACADGFEGTGRGGCTPILPEGPCATGTMALPGETRCRPVAPCGQGKWGDIPIEANTQFVDASYPGGDSDGTQGKPWTQIQTAIQNAEKGAVVAIAEGKYPEGPYLGGKTVRIWGVCPEKVEISSVMSFPALSVDASAEVHRVGLTAPSAFGLLLGPGEDIVLDRVWIHDTGDFGLLVAGFFGPTNMVMKDSLVERASGAGINVMAARATLDGVVVRDQQSAGRIGPGRGIHIAEDPDTGDRSDAAIQRSVIDHNHEVGVVVIGSDATIEASVVRDTLADDQGKHGIGIAIQAGKAPSKMSISGSVIQHSRQLALAVIGSEVSVDTTVVDTTVPQDSDNLFGDGLCALGVGPVNVEVKRSLFQHAARAGITNFSGRVTIEQSGFECNSVHLDGESPAGDYVFDDLGGNACSCGDEGAPCQVLSTHLEPPQPLP